MVVPPEMLRELYVAVAVGREGGKERLQIVDCARFIPALGAEVLERFDDDSRLDHVVEDGLEQVHDEVLFDVDAGGRRKRSRERRDLLDFLRGEHVRSLSRRMSGSCGGKERTA